MRLWRWWTLDNSTKSATLLARLATTLGVLVVARFFLETPQLSYIVANTYHINREALAETFTATGQQVPDYAVVIADDFDARFEHEFLSVYGGFFDRSTVEFASDTGEPTTFFPEAYAAGYPFAEGARFIAISLDDQYESFYVAAQALAAEADEAEIARVATALTKAIVSRVSVTLSNPSRVKATALVIDPPDGLVVVQALPSSESISAGEQIEVIYESNPGTVLQQQADDFSVEWDEAGILNTGLLIAIGILFFLFWLFTTVKAIIQDPLDG